MSRRLNITIDFTAEEARAIEQLAGAEEARSWKDLDIPAARAWRKLADAIQRATDAKRIKGSKGATTSRTKRNSG